MFKNLGLGLRYFGKAFAMLFGTRLAIYLLYPVVLSIIIYWSGFALVDSLIDRINSYVTSFGWLSSIPWLEKLLSAFIALALRLLFWVLQFVFQKYIILFLMSPILALLSERVEEMQTGVKVPFNFRNFISDIARGMLIASRNFFLEMLLLMAGFIVSFIPIVGLLFPFFSLFVSSYFYGFAIMDYTSERKRLSVKESVSFIWKNKYAAIGIGLIFYMLFIIPFVGFIIAPLVSCIAATLTVLHLYNAKDKEKSIA